MTDESTVKFTIALNDPQLDDEEKAKVAQRLLHQLRESGQVEKVERTEDLNAEAEAKAVFATLMGVLTAEVNVKNIQAFLGFLGDRLGNKPIKAVIEVNNSKVTIEVGSRQELLEVERVVKELLESMEDSSNG